LATVYGIVKQHGGNIWVYSELGEGTIFKVYLPASTEAEAKVSDGAEKAAEVRGTETVLLVEDNEQVKAVAYSILKKLGYNVYGATSGNEALKFMRKFSGSVHLLLTDVVMPKMNGKELFERLAAIHPDLKVLYMSGYTNNVIAHHGVLDEGTHFVQKPFNFHTLAAKVREVLDK
jgi:DNA-binding NtrC family response regulator